MGWARLRDSESLFENSPGPLYFFHSFLLFKLGGFPLERLLLFSLLFGAACKMDFPLSSIFPGLFCVWSCSASLIFRG